jgi:hypothetical protein
MTNLSFPIQEVTESGSQLVSTCSNMTVEAKLGILVTLLLAVIGASYTLYKNYRENQNDLLIIEKIKKHDLIIPRSTDIEIEPFILPRQMKFWKSKLMFIDDLHRFAEQ